MTSHLAWLDMQLDLNNLKFVDCMKCKFDVKFFVTKELKNIVVDATNICKMCKFLNMLFSIM